MDGYPNERRNGQGPKTGSKANPHLSVSVPSTVVSAPTSPSPTTNPDSVFGPPPSASAFRANFEAPGSPSFDETNFTFGDSPTGVSSCSAAQFLTPPVQHIPPTPKTPAFVPHTHQKTLSVSLAPPPRSPRLRSAPVAPLLNASPTRHSRIHSRNLSVFFPRPGVEKATSIPEDEDVGQMLEYHATDAPPLSARLGTFKFAGQPRSENGVNGTGAPTKRRGHHHKHSVSHNFFSFMEPGQTQEEPSPESPFPSQDSTPHFSPGTSERRSSLRPLPMSHKRSPSVHILSRYLDNPEQTTALIFFAAETVLGSSLWIAGQSRGSLACTGLGYWIVFDSLGVALSSAFPSLWSLSAQEVDLQRPFSTRRLETTVSFAQSIYLIFSAVYVLKEAVEHFLLSSEGEAAHPHHNHSIGISFPAFLLWLSLASLLLSNFAYRNHSRLVDAVGSSLPHPSTVFASIPFLRRLARVVLSSLNSSPLVSRILSNPFTLAPTTFVLLLLYASYFADKSQQMTIDMLVSSIETVWTFSIAYPSAVSLGKILLQTAPERTLSGGSLESFQRAIREIRRDPRILEVLDTHLWQLTLPRSSSLSSSDAEELVASVEVHVQEDASDMDILEITRWASDKISIALGKPRVGSVTVSVVRG